MENNNEVVFGQCFCGKVQFKIEFPVQGVVNCHCSICRRMHAAAFVTWVQVLPKRFLITQGEESLSHFKTSEGTQRSFCSKCGTGLMWQNQFCPHYSISRASITSEFNYNPTGHFFYDTHVDWVSCDDSLPRFGKFLLESFSWEKYQENTIKN